MHLVKNDTKMNFNFRNEAWADVWVMLTGINNKSNISNFLDMLTVNISLLEALDFGIVRRTDHINQYLLVSPGTLYGFVAGFGIHMSFIIEWIDNGFAEIAAEFTSKPFLQILWWSKVLVR